jgi:hypothetical protein
MRSVLPPAILLLGALVGASAGATPFERDLGQCPSLRPLRPRPVQGPEALTCRQAVTHSTRRYADALLEIYQDCIARLQRGERSGHPADTCRGLLMLSLGARGLPEDVPTLIALYGAAFRFRADLAADCSDETVAALDLCADDVAGLQTCLQRDTVQHVHFLLDSQYGLQNAADPFVVIEDAGTRSCQDAVAEAGRRYVREVQEAVTDCALEDRGPGWRRWLPRRRPELAHRCVGQVAFGRRWPPLDREAGWRIAQAERALRDALAERCSDDQVAALQTCGDDVASLGECLLCSHHREALYLVGDQLGGDPPRRPKPFIDWRTLRNPVLEEQDRMLKDQSVAFFRGWFYLFPSARLAVGDPESASKPRWFYRSRDLRSWQRFIDGNGNVNGPGNGTGSPDLARIGRIWHLTYQGAREDDPARRAIFHSTSRSLRRWSPEQRIDDDASPLGPNVIDGALAEQDGYFYLGFKDRDEQNFYVTRSQDRVLDGSWLPRRRAFAGGERTAIYFAENFQFLKIDGTWRMIATGRDPEPRCARMDRGLFLNFYICSHEPFIYTIDGDGTDLQHWTNWIRRRQLIIPYEDWNPGMHANSAYLADWRRFDGFFYLFYAGSEDGLVFENRGHGKIGVARSRDLVHWRLPGDLRD